MIWMSKDSYTYAKSLHLWVSYRVKRSQLKVPYYAWHVFFISATSQFIHPKVVQEFLRPITHNDWKRFLPFARRVKVFDAITSPVSDCCRILSRASLADLMLTKPNALPLLPQLRVLQVGGNMNNDAYPWRHFFIQFLHDRLRRLEHRSAHGTLRT